MLRLLPDKLNLPYSVAATSKRMSLPPASRVISPATSTVRSPELRSISVPSIVMLSITTPALAVTAPVTPSVPPTVALPLRSNAPFISIVVALISISVSDTKSNTPSAL